ncbi:zinc finger MYM-type protein 4-like isoform X4 [Homarus americanus]|uniref:zinc finger MYM-type protein 4-like isoform X4 n=1 Tax=Homarus americanus TaxID=6706 RepID=UPI001C45D14E|nr:zinc finger MYM-type protein 4-like isoform X4 [Homarus americanus]
MEDSQRESMEVDPPEETVSAENSSAEKNIASNIEITGPSKEKDNSSKDLEADGDCSSEKGSKTLNKGTGEEASISSPSKVNDSSNDESSANVDPLGTESGNSDCEKDNENSEGNQSDSLSNSDGVCTKNNSEDSASHQADQQQSKSTFNASVSEKDDDTTHTIICNSSNSILDSNVLSEEDNLADDDDGPMEVDKEGGDVIELDKQGGDVVEVDKQGDVMEVDKQGDIIELDKQGDVVEVDKQGGDVVEVDKQGGDVVEVDKQGGDVVEVELQGGDLVEVDMQGGDVEANKQGGDVVAANKQGGDALENEKQGEDVMETDRAKTDKEGGNERFGKEKSRSEEKDGNDTENRKEDSEEDIVEVPVYKKPAVVVDLALDDEADDTNKDDKTSDKNSSGEESNTEGSSRRIKLRSLASLVDTPNEESSNVVISTVHPDVPAIGEIVEHGVIIGSDEMGGLQLRISNVVGGEDCITGLSLDEDRDSFSHIQISSVTTLMDPMSPEDPNQGKDDSATAKPSDKDTPSKENSSSQELPETEVNNADKSSDAIEDIQKDTTDESNTSGIKIVNSESLSSKSSDGKDTDKAESAGPKIRLSSAVSEVAKDTGTSDEAASTAKFIYHILRSILTVNRECVACCKSKRCDFRITKKNESGTFAFLCSAECRTRWTSSLTSDHVVEKPRLIFEKMCGMCGKDLVNVSRSGQYSWETREFCTKTCLTSHLNEVAGECHTCREKVKSLFIGKYCVRFGSDIHQFCSNTCLERYKTKIKVCCYCQKNLEKVQKLTSVANKEYCSMKCLKRAQRRDIGQQNYCEQHSCTVCQTEGVNRYEFMSNQEPYQLCSDPCLNVYKYVNRVKAVACCLCFRVLNAEDVCHYLYHGGHQLRVFCSDSCVNVFILSARKIVVCDTCKVKKYNFDMIHRQVDEDFRDYFYCSLNCLNTKDLSPLTKNSTSSDVSSTTTTTTTNNTASTNSSDAPITPCNMCNNMAKAQYHMVMSDNTLRSFCRYACATKYKNTYGFQVNGIQTDSTQNSTALPPIRPKPSTQVTATISALPSGNEATIQAKKNAVNDVSQEVVNRDEQALQNSELHSATSELLKLLTPPTMVNKMTSCRPSTLTKGVYCKPHPWHRQTQTDSSGINCSLFTSEPPPIIPVPIPVYVPAPMMMYNAPYPVPLFVPIPLPVPIFIPTTAKTSEDIKRMMKKIQDEMPSDPYEAEMLLLARASSESAENEAKNEQTEKLTLPDESENADDGGGDLSSLENFTTYSGGNEVENDDLSCTDVTCLNTIEEDLPRYPLRLFDEMEVSSNCSSLPNDIDSQNEDIRGKRQASIDDRRRPRKRLRRTDSSDSQSMSDPDDPDPEPEPEREAEPEPEPLLEEEYQGPYLNKHNVVMG